MVEPRAWAFTSGLLKVPELLRPVLEEMIERGRGRRLRGDPSGDERVVVFVLPERTIQMGG